MTISALLTGKGNSTLRNKNIRVILDKPLLAYPAEAAIRSRYITSFYVSSEDESILNIANKYGYKMIKRPKRLSRPSSQHRDVILHSLDVMEERDGVIPDILVVLLANSACIKTKWIDKCIANILNDRSLSAVVPVCKNPDHHPFRAKRIDKNGLLRPFFDFGERTVSTNRQDLEPSYFLCHNFWVLNLRKSVMAKKGQVPWTFMGDKIAPFEVPECYDVHAPMDIEITELWLKKNRAGKL